MNTRKPRLLVVYHFFHPDDVVSARIFSDFAEGQRDRGWDVTALTSNRVWHDARRRLPAREQWRGIDIVRTYRPPLAQGRSMNRLANAAWLVSRWLNAAARMEPFDAVVVGTDPPFAALMLPRLRRLWPQAAIVHWCFDLYPDALEAHAGRWTAPLTPLLRRVMRRAYRACDIVVDLGPRMRQRLEQYGCGRAAMTLVPWALVDSPAAAGADARVRAELFGDAELGLLYSGTLGRAHDFEPFLDLARRSRQRLGHRVAFAFACRGHRTSELKSRLGADDTNVRLADFCAEDQLNARLLAADLHLLSLRPEWSGTVVPSKFFASLAACRPVLYAGPHDSDIAHWIRVHDAGLTLAPHTVDAVLAALERWCHDRAGLDAWQRRAGQVYRQYFSKVRINDEFDTLLRGAVVKRRLTDVTHVTDAPLVVTKKPAAANE